MPLPAVADVEPIVPLAVIRSVPVVAGVMAAARPCIVNTLVLAGAVGAATTFNTDAELVVTDNVVKWPAAGVTPPIAGGAAKRLVNPTPVTAPEAERAARVLAPLAPSVVNAPAAAAVPPMEGGEANKPVMPAPDTTPVALSVGNAPVLGVVLPIGPGAAWNATNPAPETSPDALSVVNAPVEGVTLPIGPGAARAAASPDIGNSPEGATPPNRSASMPCAKPVGVMRLLAVGS
jgi:hypothetical protein